MLKSKRDYTNITLFAFTFVLFMGKCWDGILLEDTVRYASVSKCILSSGDWLTMHEIPDLKYFNKPPLYFWLTALLFKIFGTVTWAARFWSALSGVMVVMLVYEIVRIYRDKNTALLAGLILGCTNDFLRYSSVGRIDAPQLFFMVLAIWGFVKAIKLNKDWFLLVPGVACGLGMLTKGPVVLSVLPLLIIIAVFIGKLRRLLGAKFWLGILLGGIIAIPWHLAVGGVNGEFWNQYFGHEMVGRINSEWLENKSRLIFIRVLFEHNLPWVIFSIVGIYGVIKKCFILKNEDKEDINNKKFGILILVWLMVSVIIAFAPPRMYGRYLLPLFPALSIFAAISLRNIIKEKYIIGIRHHLLKITILMFLLFVFVPIERHKSDRNYKIKEIATIVKKELGSAEKIGLYLTEVHAPKAMVYFYTDRVPDKFNNVENAKKYRLVITSKAGMAKLKEEGFVGIVEAKKMILAKRVG